MSKYVLLLYSKNKSSLINFLNFVKNNFSKNISIFRKLIRKKKIKESISVLKSPHVNKTAQEHFKYIYFSMSLSLHTVEIKKNLFVLKRIKDQLFPDLKIIIKGIFSKKTTFKNVNIKTFGNQRCPIMNQQDIIFLKNINLFKKTLSYLKILDCNGKI